MEKNENVELDTEMDQLEEEDTDLFEEEDTVTDEETSEDKGDPFDALYEDEEEDDEAEEDNASDNDESENEEIPAESKPDNVSKDENKAEHTSSELERAARELLKSLGNANPSDPVEELYKLAAEANGMSPAEYKVKLADERSASAAWEKQMADDLSAIHEAFPETKKYKSFMEFPNAKRFSDLMDDDKLKLSPVEAFAASHTEIVKSQGKKNEGNSLKGTKDHITSSVPKSAKDEASHLTKSEMRRLKEVFPEKSEKEIAKLYKSVTK